MLELVTEKGDTRAHMWIDAEKHFLSQFSLVALTNGNFTRAGRFLQMRKSCIETLHLPTAVGSQFGTGDNFPPWLQKELSYRGRGGIPRAGPGGTSSWLLMSKKWERFCFIWNFPITQAVVCGPAGRPECCRSLHSGDVREATDIRECTSTAAQQEFPTSNFSSTHHKQPVPAWGKLVNAGSSHCSGFWLKSPSGAPKELISQRKTAEMLPL